MITTQERSLASVSSGGGKLMDLLARPEIFLDAERLWITPLLATLEIILIAPFNSVSASFLSFASTSAKTFLAAVLS